MDAVPLSIRMAFPGRSAALLLFLPFPALACERGSAPDTDAPHVAMGTDTVAAPVRDTVLEAAFRDAAAGIEGAVGVAVLHLQTGVHASVNGDRRFVLASVGKLPIAYAAMQRGQVSPVDSVVVASADRAPGDTPFAPGMVVPLARMVERSLAHSDNTASDVLLRLAGGPEEVNRRIQALGARDVRVDRSMRQIFAEWRGIPDARDLRDTGTAEGIVALLAALHRGEELRPEARQVVLEALQAAVTGPNRIRAGVPTGATVAHKTATLGPLTHDVGIITLPARGGEVALAVLVQSAAPLAARERLIAAASRAVWKRFGAEAGAVP